MPIFFYFKRELADQKILENFEKSSNVPKILARKRRKFFFSNLPLFGIPETPI